MTVAHTAPKAAVSRQTPIKAARGLFLLVTFQHLIAMKICVHILSEVKRPRQAEARLCISSSRTHAGAAGLRGRKAESQSQDIRKLVRCDV